MLKQVPSCRPSQHTNHSYPFHSSKPNLFEVYIVRLYHGHCLLLLLCSRPLYHQELLHLTQFSSLPLFPPGNFTVHFFLTIRPQKPLSPLTFWFATSETLISRMQYSDRHSNLSLHSHSISIPIDNSSPGQIASLKSLSCKFPLILLLHRTFQVKPQTYINLTLPFLYLPKELNMEKNNIPA